MATDIEYDCTAFVGDLHGAFIEFSELVEQIRAKYSNPRIILLGDFFDRGERVIDCLNFARENKFESVIGNHDYRFLGWLKTRDTSVHYYQPYYSEISDDNIDYLRTLPYYIELEDVVCAHAGLKPGLPLTRQEPRDLMYLRYTDNNRRTISLKKINKFGKESTGAKYWTSFMGTGYPKNIIYGHHIMSQEDPTITHYGNGTMSIGIDTGCVFGGHLLSAVVPRLSTNDGHDWNKIEFLKIKAKKVYHASDFAVR